jgi:hypothetical protein
MNQDILELRLKLRTIRERETELRQKVEETRDLLSKADARRIENREQPDRWNTILDNLETSYRLLKQELDRNRISAGRIEGELNRLIESLELAGEEQAEEIAVPVVPEEAIELLPTSGQEIYTPADEFSEIDVKLGWRDLLHMTLEDLATLTAAEMAQVRECLLPGRSASMTDTDRRLIEGRLLLAAELRSSARPGEVEDLEQGERRRQIILRAAIEKIQNHRTTQMTDEELRAVLWCQQRLSKKSSASAGEKRLLRIIDAAISLIRRHRRQGNL